MSRRPTSRAVHRCPRVVMRPPPGRGYDNGPDPSRGGPPGQGAPGLLAMAPPVTSTRRYHRPSTLRPQGGPIMPTLAQTEARKLRGRLHHPIIDADGHWAEFHPLMRQEFRRIGGDTAVEALDMASA